MTVIKKAKAIERGTGTINEYLGFTFEKFGRKIVLELSYPIPS